MTNYTREELEGRLVVGVVNFPARQIVLVMSEFLVLGVPDEDGRVILLRPLVRGAARRQDVLAPASRPPARAR